MPKFITLPQQGGDQRAVAEVVRGIMDGRTNNTGLVTLATGNATTTTLYDERIGYDSVIILTPYSSAAANDTLPYCSYTDNTDQYTTANTPTVVQFNTVEVENGTYLSSNKVYFRNGGDYNVQFSLQFANTDTQIAEATVWLRKNGVDVVDTASKYSVPNKHGGVDGYLIAVANFFVDVVAGDYIELVWAVSAAANSGGTVSGIYMEKYSANTTPFTYPAVPSAVITAQYNKTASMTNVYVSSQTRGSAVITHFANNTADKTYKYIIVG